MWVMMAVLPGSYNTCHRQWEGDHSAVRFRRLIINYRLASPAEGPITNRGYPTINMNKFNKKNKRGFTLIELLVTVLILAILMAIALPLYLSAIADSERKTCRANLQTIANAEMAYRARTRDPFTATLGDLLNTPVCPNAGTYTVAVGTPANSFTVLRMPRAATAKAARLYPWPSTASNTSFGLGRFCGRSGPLLIPGLSVFLWMPLPRIIPTVRIPTGNILY